MKEYKADPELTELLTMLCKLGMGFSKDMAIIDLSLRKWFVFDNYNAESILMNEANAFTTRTSIVYDFMTKKARKASP